MLSCTTIGETEAQLALERVLSSRVFAKADRSRRFLKYLVDAALALPPIMVKEFTIAMDVFDRPSSYDTSIDSTVRVEAGRLRARLREYYSDEGRSDALIIEVPKGGYAATFCWREATAESSNAHQMTQVPQNDLHNLRKSLNEQVRPSYLERIPSLWWIIACGLVLLLAIPFGLRTIDRHRAKLAASTVPSSLAILPVKNHTGDASLDHVCDGFTDEVIRQLSQLPSLRLIAPATVLPYRHSTLSPLEAGRTLHVGAVVTAELRRVSDHLSLVAEMIDTSDGTVLLDREYMTDSEDLRSVQADLQKDVIDKLHVDGSARDPGRSPQAITTSSQAYQEFLNGDSLARSGAPAELHEAMGHFERAVLLDPKFDLAWSAMASAHVMLGLYFEAPRDHMPQARRFAETALKINPSLGEAHGSLGVIHLVYDWKPAAAEAEMNAAGAQQAAISVLSCTAHLIERAGKPRRAEELLSRMLTYDPNSASLIAELGCVDYYRGSYPSALLHYQEALAADPRSPVPYWGIGKTLTAEHKYSEAITALNAFRQKNGFEPPILTAEKGYAMASAGRTKDALELIGTLEDRSRHEFIDPYLVAMIYASMRNSDEVFAWLNKAFDARSPFIISLITEPKWELLRSDPRFEKLILRMLGNKES